MRQKHHFGDEHLPHLSEKQLHYIILFLATYHESLEKLHMISIKCGKVQDIYVVVFIETTLYIHIRPQHTFD